MPQLFLPTSARDHIQKDRAEIAIQYMAIDNTIRHYTAELRRIDPHLRMVKAHDRVAPDSSLKAGYYHILRDMEGTAVNVLPLQYDNGEYREPGSWIFPYLEEQDMWNDRARRASRKRQEAIRAATERQRERERQDRVDEFNERWASANRTSIRVSRAIG